MARRTNNLKHVSSKVEDSEQTTLDLEYGIKSTIPSKSKSELKGTKVVTYGVKTRSMSKQTCKDEKQVETDDIGISSPKKKTKIKINKGKTLIPNKGNKIDEHTLNIPAVGDGFVNVNEGNKIFINNKDEFEEKSDDLLPPTAPESQLSSPMKSNELFELLSSKSEFVQIKEEKKLHELLKGEYNTDSSLYNDIVSGKNKSKLEGLMMLELPKKYEYLLDIFQGLEITLRLLERRQKPFFYSSLVREQVENVTKKTFCIDNLQKLLWIAPQLLSARWCKLSKFELESERSNLNKNSTFGIYELEIVVNQGLNNPVSRISSLSINERVNTLRLIMLNFVLIQQENYLKDNLTNEINVTTTLSNLCNWSTLFNVESCVDIPKIKLPSRKTDECKLSSGSEERKKFLSVTPSARSFYKFKMISSISNIEDYLDNRKRENRRSLSNDEKRSNTIDLDKSIKTPTRNKNKIIYTDELNNEDSSLSSSLNKLKSDAYTTPRRSIRSSALLTRSVSPMISTTKTQASISQYRCSKLTTQSNNKHLLTPSQKELLFTVKRREKIKEISRLINVEDDEYNIRLEQVKNELWTVQQISFIFLHSKKLIPTTQLPLLAKRLTTYARNCPSIIHVQNSIVSLSNKFPETITLCNSTIDKGIKLVKLKINDDNITEIIKNLTEEKNVIIKEREEFRLNTISDYQKC